MQMTGQSEGRPKTFEFDAFPGHYGMHISSADGLRLCTGFDVPGDSGSIEATFPTTRIQGRLRGPGWKRLRDELRTPTVSAATQVATRKVEINDDGAFSFDIAGRNPTLLLENRHVLREGCVPVSVGF